MTYTICHVIFIAMLTLMLTVTLVAAFETWRMMEARRIEEEASEYLERSPTMSISVPIPEEYANDDLAAEAYSAAFEAGEAEGYDRGHYDGYQEGYDDGAMDGEAVGYRLRGRSDRLWRVALVLTLAVVFLLAGMVIVPVVFR